MAAELSDVHVRNHLFPTYLHSALIRSRAQCVTMRIAPASASFLPCGIYVRAKLVARIDELAAVHSSVQTGGADRVHFTASLEFLTYGSPECARPRLNLPAAR